MSRSLSIFLLLVLLAAPVAAETRTEAEFTLAIRGIPVGRLALAGTRGDDAYAAAATIDSTGAARIIRRFSYRARAEGRVADGLRPARYEEVADTGNRRSEAVIAYENGVPQVLQYASPRAPAPDSPAPETQGGTLDPLSALFAVLGDRAGDTPCGRTYVLFDGKRRSHILLGAPQEDAGTVTCAGEYRRLQGFTPEELKRHVAFPVRASFAASGGVMQAMQLEIETVYGLATVLRR